ncbi:MAG: hypothetical protein WCI48_11615 [Bacteroidota bacterium]|jgi:hypothetical protein
MKTKIFCLFLVVFISLKLSAQNDNPVLLVKEAATAKAMYFLDLIPVGSENDYGFGSRSDFSKIKIGEPYQTYYVSGRNNHLEFFSGNEWRVPVSVDGAYQALLTVRISQGKAEVVGIGGSVLARNIQKFETILPDKTNERVMIRNTYLEQYFITANFTALCGQSTGNGFIEINTASLQPVYELNEGMPVKTSIAVFYQETMNLVNLEKDTK